MSPQVGSLGWGGCTRCASLARYSEEACIGYQVHVPTITTHRDATGAQAARPQHARARVAWGTRLPARCQWYKPQATSAEQSCRVAAQDSRAGPAGPDSAGGLADQRENGAGFRVYLARACRCAALVLDFPHCWFA